MATVSAISVRYLHDERSAFAHLESILWPDGPVCPHCGSVSGKHYDLRKTRIGLRKCSDCRKQFTVKIHTVFESAHLPLHKMLQAVYLLCASKKGISSHQLHRILGIQYKSAWFLSHRIREAFRSEELASMGGDGGIVEADETFIGRKECSIKRRGHGHKNAANEFSSQHQRFCDAYDALKCLLARNPQPRDTRSNTVGGKIFWLYVQASDILAKTPAIAVVYTFNPGEVIIHGINTFSEVEREGESPE